MDREDFVKVHIQKDYDIYLKKISDSIVLIDTTGTMKHFDLERFNEALEAFCLQNGVKTPYVQIRDLSSVTGRLPFHLMKAQVAWFLAHPDTLRGVVLLHAPRWLQAFVNQGRKVYRTPFQVAVTQELPEAIQAARRMLAPLPGGARVRRPLTPEDLIHRDEWGFDDDRSGCSCHIGVIPDKLYFVRVAGTITCPEDIARGGRLLERVLLENQLIAVPFIVVDYSGLTSIRSLRLRQLWAREADRINRLTHNTRSVHVAIAPDRLTRTAIRLFAPFLQQKIWIVESTREAFETINQLSGTPNALERKRDLRVSAADLEEVGDALGMLLWHAGERIHDSVMSPDNPLSYLFETIELVKSDLNDLLERERLSQEARLRESEAHRRRLERSLAEQERLRAQLLQAQKMEAVGRLAGGVAHDFNNMLSVIKGNVEEVLDQLETDSPLREELEEIRLAAQNSANLTRQLLTFARRQAVTPRVLDLDETVTATLAMLRRLIGEDVNLTWRPAGDLGPVLIDPGQVDQALANLCVNARDAISGPGHITIETRNERLADATGELDAGDYVVLSVADDGCGMSPETLAKLFEPFFTTKEPGKGTGLGLSMIYGIARQNGGTVTVRSAEGEGSVFEVWLPRYAGDRPVAPRPSPPERPARLGQGETVLLVEDEESILRLARRVLTKQGYQVLATSDPRRGLELAREHDGAIDLLITDVVMPELNGRELATAVLALHPGARRLYMSGYTREIITHQGVLEDGVHFLHKPFSASELVAKVREALESPCGAEVAMEPRG